MSRDMMSAFELYQPDTVEGAVELLGRFGAEGWALAGGNDSFDWFKDRVKRPKYVVDLGGIAALKGIRETPDGGVEIGALTTLTELETSSVIQGRYKVLADAARRVASPQIRNSGTIGGNVAQDARCWYYRYGVDCYRAGGNTCYADTPEGQNREHCLWGADRCVAVSPSDTAPALVALGATARIVDSSGRERTVAMDKFFVTPRENVRRETVLQPNEILIELQVPDAPAASRAVYMKEMVRETFDFALSSVAAMLTMKNGVVEDARIVLGGVAPVPYRALKAEEALRGKRLDEATAAAAGVAATDGARPMTKNAYKVPLTQAVVKRALLSLV